MGRWKYDNSGQLNWDATDSGPDQGTPTPEQQAAQSGTTGGSTGSGYTVPQPNYPSPSDPGYWSDPNRSDYSPTNPIWPAQTTDPSVPGYIDPSKPQPIDGGFNGGQPTDPNNWASLVAPGTPYGNQPGSQDTGIANPAQSPQSVAVGEITSPPAGGAPPTGGQSGPWNGAGVPLGFDATKWNDITKNDPKYDVGHMVASGWGNDQISQYLAQHYPGYTVSGKDTITDPQGNVFDFRNGVNADPKGQGTAQWTQVGGPGGGTTATGAAPGAGGSGVGSGMTGANGFSSAGFSGSPYSAGAGANSLFAPGSAGNLYDLLMQRATQSLTPSAQDPIIANQVNAYSATQQRSAEKYLNDLAESSGPTANLGEEKRAAAEQVGQNTGGFQAQLMQKEVDARRTEIQNALNGAMGFLTEEQRMNLQKELAYLDMSQRAYEFDTNDEFRRSPLAS